MGSNSIYNDFLDHFTDQITKTDRSIIIQRFGALALRNQRNKGLIQIFRHLVEISVCFNKLAENKIDYPGSLLDYNESKCKGESSISV